MRRRYMRVCAFLAACWLVLLTLQMMSITSLSEILQFQSGAWEMPRADPRLRCLSGWVASATRGELADRVLEYASAWSLAELHGLRLAAPQGLLQVLGSVFKNLSARSLKSLLATPECSAHQLTEKEVLRHAATEMQLYPVNRYVQWAANNSQPVILSESTVLLDTIVPLCQQLRRKFRYRDTLAAPAAATLAGIRARMAARAGVDASKVLVVGMHAQHTNGYVGFYRRATVHMRQQLASYNKPIAFAVVTNVSWFNQYLLPVLEPDFQRSDLPTSAAFLASKGDKSNTAQDLALLSFADHSIFTYGPFGMWSALVAGGRTVVFDVRAADPAMAVDGTAAWLARRLNPRWVTMK